MPDPKDPRDPPGSDMPPVGGPAPGRDQAPGTGFSFGVDGGAIGKAVGGFIQQLGKPLLHQAAKEARELAKEGGTACSMPDCDAFTMGTRCETCGRRTCLDHTYRRLEGVKPVPYCVYCVIKNHPEFFETDDDDDASDRERG